MLRSPAVVEWVSHPLELVPQSKFAFDCLRGIRDASLVQRYLRGTPRGEKSGRSVRRNAYGQI